MGTKKYEFTGDTQVWLGRTLHRIRALRSFGNVKAGDLGGWIEKEENLSHDGRAWVYEEAKVSGDACVFENARVYGNAMVFEEARVSGIAKVFGYARVCGKAWVSEEAWVFGEAWVSGEARVFGDPWVYGEAEVCNNARIWKKSHYLNIGPIGSRLKFTTFFRAEGNQIYVKCGCFRGNIDEFVFKVKVTHGDNHHAKEYMAAVELAKAHFDLSEEE